MRKNRFLAAVGVSVGLMAGGVAGAVLGIPGISGAQTQDTPSTTAPAPAPDSGGTTPAPDADGATPRVLRGENCPEKDGAGPEGAAASGTATPLRIFHSGGGRA